MLRNAFEAVATEGTLRRVLNAVTWARDVNDRLRVVVDNTVAAAVYRGNTTATATADSQAPYAASTWNVMDARDEQRVRSRTAGELARQRWTYTP